MKKIRGLQVENEDKLISFDMKSLFTKYLQISPYRSLIGG